MTEDSEHYLRRTVPTSPFHQWLRPEVESVDVASGEVTIRIDMREEFCRSPGQPEAHGGILAALIDIAGHAAVAAKLRHAVPTIDLRIDYLRMAGGSALRARAVPVKIGRSIGVADVRVVDDAGRLVAIGRGAFSTRRE